jgi:hypothetical protein
MSRFLTTFKMTGVINNPVTVTTGNIGIFEERSSKTMGRFSGECYEEFIQTNQKEIIRRSLFHIFNLIGDTSAV